MHARDHDDLIIGWKLHDLARGHELAGGFRTRDHQMTEPGRKPVPGVVLHRPHLGGGTEPIRHPLGGPFVVGGEGHTHMAIVEDGVVRPISLLDLVERLRSEAHTSELQSLMRSSYSVFCLTKHKT